MDTLSPGTRLGRYEIRSKIGEGGMGQVYLAEDLQLHRKVALKVLPPEVAANSDRMRRFKQEAQAAAALNHPNIAHIYEIGESDGANFIAMEFVDGRTLREQALTKSSEVSDVLEIAIQIANAISAAHAAGIVHRDIKPENVMIRGDGLVKVLDFGLAKLARPKDWRSEDATLPLLRTDTGVMMGTVFYMSPEQARGLPVDARTDIWSLGVVIFETISGRLPFDGATRSDILVSILEREPPPLTVSPPTFTNELQRIVTKTLRKNREERYQEVNDLLVDLKKLRQEVEISGKLLRTPNQESYSADRSTEIAAITSPPSAGASEGLGGATAASRIISGKLIAAIAMAALVIVIIGIYFVFFNHRAALTEKDTIMLADFVNQTGDPTFDGSTLKQALAIQLRQTPFVKLFPEESVRETLRYMGRSEDEPLTKPTAREICRRQGLKALIVGSIASLGRDYVITLEAVNGQTGETIASQQLEAPGKEQVLKSLGQAALDLRKQLGESLAYLQKYNAPIEQATTSSLEALNIYSKGLEQIYSGDYKSALPLFNRAVELDPNFAEAYVWLSWTYANFGDFGKTSEFAEKAFGLRSRVTELEKLRIDDIYHLWVTGDFDKQKEADYLIARLYPNDWVPHNSLIMGYNRFGQLEQALAEGREGIRVNPNEVHLYWHVSTVLIRLNRFDEAADAIEQGQKRKLDFFGYRNNLYVIAFTRDDSAEMHKQVELIRKTDGEASAFTMRARTAIFYGRWREAQALSLRTMALAGQPPVHGTNPPLPVTATTAEALLGFCQPAGDDVKQSLAVSRIVSSSPIMLVPVLANGSLCGDANEAQKLADEEARRYPRAIQQSVFSVPMIRAAIALQRNQPDQAIQFLNLALPYEGGSGGYSPDYLRGQAYLRLQKGSEAAVEFQKILDHRGWDPMSPMYPLAYLGLARATMLMNDAATARKHYDDFFALWKDADQDLPILMEAKKEYQELTN